MKKIRHILEVGKAINLKPEDLIMYGDNKAKIKEPFKILIPTVN